MSGDRSGGKRVDRDGEISTPGAWLRLLAGVAAVFALFHVAADRLGSVRGEAGLGIGAAVVVAVLLVERSLLGGGIAARSLRAPARRGLLAATAVSAALLAVIPIVAWSAGRRMELHPGWPLLLPGLFAQAGIAEEILFRGLLFGHVRRGRGFWRAALLATLPFIAVHLVLFATLPWPIALASVLLSAVISLPLARLYELGGDTMWPPAIVHFVVQGAIKIITVEGAPALPLIWMAASATLPFLVFAVRADSSRARRP